MPRSHATDLLESLAVAADIGAGVLLSPVLRPWYSRWGTTDDEVERAFPGDDLVPHPRLKSTRAITVRAPARAVWPWLAQRGQARGGLQSYDR